MPCRRATLQLPIAIYIRRSHRGLEAAPRAGLVLTTAHWAQLYVYDYIILYIYIYLCGIQISSMIRPMWMQWCNGCDFGDAMLQCLSHTLAATRWILPEVAEAICRRSRVGADLWQSVRMLPSSKVGPLELCTRQGGIEGVQTLQGWHVKSHGVDGTWWIGLFGWVTFLFKLFGMDINHTCKHVETCSSWLFLEVLKARFENTILLCTVGRPDAETENCSMQLQRSPKPGKVATAPVVGWMKC